jgi:hypothetical protein
MKNSLLKPLVFLILGLFVFTSCQEDEIDSIFFRTDGGIATVIKDGDGQAISEAKVALYNYRTENRVSIGYTDESGRIDFGRFEAGEYSILADFQHNDEYFQIEEEVHIISGTNTQHQINTTDHYGDLLVRILDNSTGQPLEFNPGVMIGLVPVNEDMNQVTNEEDFRELIQYSFESEVELSIADLPEASYVVLMYNDESIIQTSNAFIDPFNKDYVNFYVNPTSLLLMSKSTWVVSNITAEDNQDNIMPISSISFSENENMLVTYENGETDDAYFSMYSNGNFDWYNLGTDNYNFYFGEDYYNLNSDGSITFYFGYWETYNSNDGNWYYSNNVSITIS